MNENIQDKREFMGYEYKNVTVKHEIADIYIDCFPYFGWILERKMSTLNWIKSITLKFKRDRKIINKIELTRLQREFESRIREIDKLTTSMNVNAVTMACIVGIIGTAFMAGATFAFLADMILLCIILAVPAFIGWIIPYFCYVKILEKKTKKNEPLIEQQYDLMYEACEKANMLCHK